jgi:biopolymer transport protein ExbD
VLPTANATDPRDPADTVTISVTRDATIGWNKELIIPDEFIARLTALRQIGGENTRILINADEEATFNQVFGYVINEIRKAGIRRVFFETRFLAAEG